MKTNRAERNYARQLRAIAQHVGTIVNGFPPGDPLGVPPLQELLRRYADALTPWAQATAGRMLLEINGNDREAWRALGNAISLGLHRELQNAPVGDVLRSLLNEQVVLIKSLPIEAGERVHKLTLQGLEDSTRAKEIANEILRTGEVTESRATLIARTEVARTSTALTQSRALHAGITHYVWRISNDKDVRPGHRAMNGKVCEFAEPPAVEENGKIMHFHAGQIWNCRCYADPVIPFD